jgi:protein-L-isoaspartate(D-aspartate) O-methyltransferase
MEGKMDAQAELRIVRDEASERALAEAFARGGLQQVTRLYRDQDIPDERCWLRGPGWCLAHE